MGKMGRKAVALAIPELKKELAPDLVIANVENLAHGHGVTIKTLREVLEAGVDFFTAGNHIWKKKEAFEAIADPDLKDRLVRPANYPEGVPGKGYKVLEIGARKVLIASLLARVFIKEDTDCPFRKMDEILEKHGKENLAAIIVDFHSEATSEKKALGYYLDGRVSAVLGTHTHVPTADAEVLSGGTAYVSDVGMVGGKDTVLGVEKDAIIKGFLTQMPVEQEFPESGPCQVNAVYVEIDPKDGKAIDMKRIDRTVEIP